MRGLVFLILSLRHTAKPYTTTNCVGVPVGGYCYMPPTYKPSVISYTPCITYLDLYKNDPQLGLKLIQQGIFGSRYKAADCSCDLLGCSDENHFCMYTVYDLTSVTTRWFCEGGNLFFEYLSAEPMPCECNSFYSCYPWQYYNPPIYYSSVYAFSDSDPLCNLINSKIPTTGPSHSPSPHPTGSPFSLTNNPSFTPSKSPLTLTTVTLSSEIAPTLSPHPQVTAGPTNALIPIDFDDCTCLSWRVPVGSGISIKTKHPMMAYWDGTSCRPYSGSFIGNDPLNYYFCRGFCGAAPSWTIDVQTGSDSITKCQVVSPKPKECPRLGLELALDATTILLNGVELVIVGVTLLLTRGAVMLVPEIVAEEHLVRCRVEKLITSAFSTYIKEKMIAFGCKLAIPGLLELSHQPEFKEYHREFVIDSLKCFLPSLRSLTEASILNTTMTIRNISSIEVDTIFNTLSKFNVSGIILIDGISESTSKPSPPFSSSSPSSWYNVYFLLAMFLVAMWM
jgi:hypothetical protein